MAWNGLKGERFSAIVNSAGETDEYRMVRPAPNRSGLSMATVVTGIRPLCQLLTVAASPISADTHGCARLLAG